MVDVIVLSFREKQVGEPVLVPKAYKGTRRDVQVIADAPFYFVHV
jgi:hypothetical protein